MKRTLTLLVGMLAVVGCTPAPAIPNAPDINVNGSYTARIVGLDSSSALLDVTIVEKNLAVTATVKSRDTGQVVTLTGTRSVYKASPVEMNLTQELGSGSPCERGSTERYAVNATFYAQSQNSGEGAKGSARHEVCDPASGLFRPIAAGTGSLELVRQ